MKFQRVDVMLALLAAILAVGIMADTKPVMAEALEVFVSIPPQAYFVERVGGQFVRVHTLCQVSRDPHTFEPTPKQMMALGQARLYFKIGMEFEHELLKKIQSDIQQLTVIDTAAGIQKRMMIAYHHNEHEPESHEHEHHVREADPHIWLAPPLINIQAQNIAKALIKQDPAHAEAYRANLAGFMDEVEATHGRIKKILSPYKGQAFFVFHPSFGYFGDTYGLIQGAVEMGGKSPTPKQLSQLIEKATADKVKIIFVQPQFNQKSAMAVAEAIGGTVMAIDPLAKDVLKNLEAIANNIEKALQ
jgi:zinc transport system substrate-binding protein